MAQTQVVSGVATSVRPTALFTYGKDSQMANARVVRYHNTDVWAMSYVPWGRYHANRVVLSTGGYRTVTTKRRMNQANNEYDSGVHVYQRDWEWYVTDGVNDHEMKSETAEVTVYLGRIVQFRNL